MNHFPSIQKGKTDTDFKCRGSIGERMNVRYFLTIGMLLSATFSFLFGLAYWTNIHSLTYFIIIQVKTYFIIIFFSLC